MIIVFSLGGNLFTAESWDGLPAAEAPQGSGTVENPYQITDAACLKWFADTVNSGPAKSTSTLCAVLVADINLAGVPWTPIGFYNSYNECLYYGGVFDGNGKTITGLSIDAEKQYQALFGYVKDGTIKNLTVNGCVSTSTTSSAYIAGLVGYGAPVTVENCVSNVSVTAPNKGYAAGIVGYAGNGSKIVKCTNNGNVFGGGDYVGGIVATAISTVIENCINTGDVNCTGKPGSYAYCVGGIAGGATSASSITMCANTGNITSTLKRTGGIVGSLGGSVEKSFNTGIITGTYGVGGVVGDSADKASTVVSCYNTGKVIANTPVLEFTDANAKGVGGIIGGVSSNTNMATLKNCYNTGAIIVNSVDNTILSGGIVGNSSGKNYSGVVTAGLVRIENCYYLDTVCSQGDGYDVSVTAYSRTEAEMKAAGFAQQVGSDFIDCIGGYPLLGWQDPNACYPVAFTVEPAGASLQVYNEQGAVMPSETTVYNLMNGNYTYIVTGEECEPVTGQFTVAYGGQNIKVVLQVKKYDVHFTVVPDNAVLTVSGQTPLSDGRTYQLAKVGNPYTYTVSAFGYEPVRNTFSVSGETNEFTVQLEAKPQSRVTFSYSKEDGGKESSTKIYVTSKECPTAEITAQPDGSFLLPDGSYSYKISSAGYKSIAGEFVVAGTDYNLSGLFLPIQTAWDGKTYTQPTVDSEGVYLITSPDELMWFNQNASLSSSAKLMADITINEAGTLYPWVPVGVSSSKAYTGTFDGDGHTLSGLYILDTSATNNIGLFGFVGTGGSVLNLKISDSSITCNGKYVGAIVGDLKGHIENCHTTETVSISGKSYVGGIVGELDSDGRVNKCSNAAFVTGTEGYVGGIAGRVYSAFSDALTNCYNSGIVTGLSNVGGIAGVHYMGGTVKNVYNIGDVIAQNGSAGGIIGQFRYGAISNAYTIGQVSADKAGVICGSLDFKNGNKTIESVYYLNGISDLIVGNENGCFIQSGVAQGCSSDELKNMAQALGDAFYEDDDMIHNGYPILFWQAGKEEEDPLAPIPDPDGWDGKTSSVAPAQQDGVFQLTSAGDLKWFAKAVMTTADIKAVLTCDIRLNYQKWSPISNFTGMLDGNGHVVSELYMNNGNALFLENSGQIKNLTVSGIINGSDYAAGITCKNNGTISGVTSAVVITAGNHAAGIAANNSGVIEDCNNLGVITGGQYVGGITASNTGSVLFCTNSGSVTGKGAFVAGVVSDNDGGIVKDSVNSGQIIGCAAIRLAYVGGVVGRNDGTAQNLYNSGNVVGLGSSVGGCVAINVIGASACKLYNIGDVCGAYIEGELRVGGAVGEVNSGVSEAYYVKTLAIGTGGTAIEADELAQRAGTLAFRLPMKSSVTGTISFPLLEVGKAAVANYLGNAESPVFIWYLSDGYDQHVLAISEEYSIPVNMVGYRLYVKVIDPSLSGVVTGISKKVDGFSGSIDISGYAVVGHVLNATYLGPDSVSGYQWYRGTTAIEGADRNAYQVTSEDLGKVLTVRAVGTKPGYIEAKTNSVQTGEQAGIWDENVCIKPVLENDVYIITNEQELKWFASYVNAGNAIANAKLMCNITLTAKNWYSIGNDTYPYMGMFDGNSKKIDNFQLTTALDEQGFFGNVGEKGVIKNLNLVGSILVTDIDAIAAGGIVGYLEGKVADCSFSGSITGAYDVGGVVGQSSVNSYILQCTNSAKVNGQESLGGIVGDTSYGNVYNCSNTGSIGTDLSINVGGIAGCMTNYAVITASYNTGEIVGSRYLGGIAGKATVCAAPQGCYNIGKISSGFYAHGILGDLSGTDYIPVVNGSYYLVNSQQEATDKTAVAVNASGMKKAAFVTMLNAQAGQDCFILDVKNENNGYPVLLWQAGSGNQETPEEPEIITVTFTLRGDDAHGSTGMHTSYVEWIPQTTCTLAKGATAYDLFQKMMEDYAIPYQVNANSYVSSISGLSEFTNGPRSGWMYTINDEFPDYMNMVKLKDGDEMLFFYTDDYKDTGWIPADSAVLAVERFIDAIGIVTIDSKVAIETARDAFNLLTDMQKLMVENYQQLNLVEEEYTRLVAEKPKKDKEAAQCVETLIEEIGIVTLESRDSIKSARTAYENLTSDQRQLITNLDVLIAAEKRFNELVGEKTALDIAAADEVDNLINLIGYVTNHSQITISYAREAYDALTPTQKAYVQHLDQLLAAERKFTEIIATRLADIQEKYQTTGTLLLNGSVPGVSSVGGEWAVLGLARAGRMSETFRVGYYENLIKLLRQSGSSQLHRTKSTENARVVIALTALGYDVYDVDGKNLLQPLADFNYVNKQGINGPIWTLIAFDTADYEIPVVQDSGTQVTRQLLIQEILNKQLSDGGWSLDQTTADLDTTAMAVQAMSPYYQTNSAVKMAVDKAILFMSAMQKYDGGYSSFGNENSEIRAQVIVALSSLGIDADADQRFVKGGKSVLDALLSFYVQGGGFSHTKINEVDGMATEQGYYALVSYLRYLEKRPGLYDMNDVIKTENPVVSVPIEDDYRPEEESESFVKDDITPNTSDFELISYMLPVLAVFVIFILSYRKSRRHTDL